MNNVFQIIIHKELNKHSLLIKLTFSTFRNQFFQLIIGNHSVHTNRLFPFKEYLFIDLSLMKYFRCFHQFENPL